MPWMYFFLKEERRYESGKNKDDLKPLSDSLTNANIYVNPWH